MATLSFPAAPAERWLVIAIAAALYVYFCVRIAGHARRMGRNPLAWFFITLLTVGIPAIFLFLRGGRAHGTDAASAVAGQDAAAGPPAGGAPPSQPVRCPHCRAMFAHNDIDRASGAPACPRCHLSLNDEVHLA